MGRKLAQGQVFAGYRIERLLGVGGMGEVYLAHDRDLPRFVALKLLSTAGGDDAEVRARFLREADTAARLSHPNIVAVYARGTTDERLWMAMQFVEGTDVAAVLAQGALRADYAVRILRETARALDHAHRAGVLHRDVKPGNILLEWGPEQRVFLADFGIAKALDQTSALTRTGEMYASFQYASPEQFELRADMDQRADVYALGCTFFHMLTGELPYPGGTTAQLVNGHLNGRIPRPSARNADVSATFDAVIERALAKDPNRRFNSCGELAAAAEQALAAPFVRGEATAPPQFGTTRGAALTTQPGGAPTGPAAQPISPLSYPTASGTYSPQQGPDPQDAMPTMHAGASGSAAPQARSRRSRKTAVLLFLVALVVVAAAGIGFGSGALHFRIGAGDTGGSSDIAGTGDSAANQAAATAVACEYAKLMTTYDYSDGSGWQAKVIDGATGTWKTDAQNLLPTIALILEQDSEHTRATAATCTITSGNSTHYEFAAEVQLVNSTKGQADTTESKTISMSMDYVDGRWLCSKWSLPLGSI
ncbi:serine/threonine protein kinase [Nocardia huaxiensis]|uniref:non-specific serine/threonine protein kinase n=1 Tax=Nocardia huaxiensis TaxID=2755382 RepID=A0A7D6V7R3_9NOCA|nr:serine/threonine-protein kinase [Nocardia huaxiensis]QLY27702.1 serine/threonine protein kinase [Nocardia huaxiensis]